MFSGIIKIKKRLKLKLHIVLRNTKKFTISKINEFTFQKSLENCYFDSDYGFILVYYSVCLVFNQTENLMSSKIQSIKFERIQNCMGD